MRLTTFLTIALTLVGCSPIPHEDLLGYWKSNEPKTLESMRATPGITEKAKELFEKDFFGKLVIEYKADTYRAKFEREEDNIEEFDQYYPYKILKKGEGYYLVESYSQHLEENETKKIYMDGNCYYVLVSKWNFREYFCRFDK